MAEDLRGDHNHAAQSLRDSCWNAASYSQQAATDLSGESPHEVESPPCPELDLPCMDDSPFEGTPMLPEACSRLQNIHAQLGPGEGVTNLVAASINDLHSGGTGIITSNPGADTLHASMEMHTAPHSFHTTAAFFERLSNCSSGLMQLPQESRESTLKRRLKVCNQNISCPQHSQVRLSTEAQD